MHSNIDTVVSIQPYRGIDIILSIAIGSCGQKRLVQRVGRVLKFVPIHFCGARILCILVVELWFLFFSLLLSLLKLHLGYHSVTLWYRQACLFSLLKNKTARLCVQSYYRSPYE